MGEAYAIFPQALATLTLSLTQPQTLLSHSAIGATGMVFGIICMAVGSYMVCKLALRLLSWRRANGRQLVLFELVPHVSSVREPWAGQQLFVDLHGVTAMRGLVERLLACNVSFSAEVVGTCASGIRFIFCVPALLQKSFERSVHAFDPAIQIRV